MMKILNFEQILVFPFYRYYHRAFRKPLLSIATHFENESNWLKAGKFFLSSGHYDRALRHFLQCHVDDSGENIILAIECVGKAKDDKLSRLLLDYLLGNLKYLKIELMIKIKKTGSLRFNQLFIMQLVYRNLYR